MTAIVQPQCFLNQGDAIEWLRSLGAGTADMGMFDPAYASLEKHRAKGTTTRLKKSDASSNEWFPVVQNDYFPELFSEYHRVLRKNTHLYVMCDSETAFVIKPMAEAAGFRFWKPIVWDKMKLGMGYHYRCRYEFILFFEKGKRRLRDLSIPDVLRVPRVNKGYPTEKPVDLWRTFVHQSTEPGEWVLDSFMGSGSSGVATLELGRNYSGNDISPASLAMAGPRCAQAISSPRPWTKPVELSDEQADELEDAAE